MHVEPQTGEQDSALVLLGDPLTWPDAAMGAFHDLWGDAVAGKPYSPLQKHKWARLLDVLERAAGATRRVQALGQK
jgi:hypothetical protein